MPAAVPLSLRFCEALAYAIDKHATQARKGSTVTYLCHPLAVASLVLEDGGDEDQAIAALLHDVVEDCGGAPVLAEVGERFGARVAAIVEACSDGVDAGEARDARNWRSRKQAYLDHLESADEAVLRVASADKLHNARSLLTDRVEIGEALWGRFHAGRDEVLWYYARLTEVLARRRPSRLTRELARTVAALAQPTIR